MKARILREVPVTLTGTQLYFTKPEVARLLKISLRFVTHLMRSGALPYLKLGRTVRFRLEDVQRQLNERCLAREGEGARLKAEG